MDTMCYVYDNWRKLTRVIMIIAFLVLMRTVGIIQFIHFILQLKKQDSTKLNDFPRYLLRLLGTCKASKGLQCQLLFLKMHLDLSCVLVNNNGFIQNFSMPFIYVVSYNHKLQHRGYSHLVKEETEFQRSFVTCSSSHGYQQCAHYSFSSA